MTYVEWWDEYVAPERKEAPFGIYRFSEGPLGAVRCSRSTTGSRLVTITPLRCTCDSSFTLGSDCSVHGTRRTRERLRQDEAQIDVLRRALDEVIEQRDRAVDLLRAVHKDEVVDVAGRIPLIWHGIDAFLATREPAPTEERPVSDTLTDGFKRLAETNPELAAELRARQRDVASKRRAYPPGGRY